MHRIVLALSVLLVGCRASAEHAVTVYAGPYTDNSLPNEIVLFQPLSFESATLAAVALSQVVGEPGEHHQWEVEGNVVQWFGHQDHQELNGLLMYRWRTFPWNDVVRTTFGIGNGLSYATSKPKLEQFFHPRTGTKNVLYHIAVEFTFAAPEWKHWSYVARIHHRSGVFGLFDGVDGGSNALTFGLRYGF